MNCRVTFRWTICSPFSTRPADREAPRRNIRNEGLFTATPLPAANTTSLRVPEETYSQAPRQQSLPHSHLPGKTIQEFQTEILDYARQMYTPGHLGVYERAFTSFLRIQGNTTLSAVDARSVDMFKVKRLADKIARNTLNPELRSLRAAFNVVLRWELIATNPFRGVRLCHLDEAAPLYFTKGGCGGMWPNRDRLARRKDAGH